MLDRKVVIIFLVLLLVWLASCLAQSAHAQTQPTVTPYPGPVATATMAAQQVQQAQAQQAQAAQLAQQAAAAQQAANNAYQQAQQNAADARAALAAQQYQQAGELLGQAEANNQAGREQLNILSSTSNSLQAIISAQYGVISAQYVTLTQVSTELIQCRVSVSNTVAAYNAVSGQLTEAKANATSPVLLIALGLALVFLIGVVLIFVNDKWRMNAALPKIIEPTIEPPIEAEVIDDDTA